jgi:hypothetical protein
VDWTVLAQAGDKWRAIAKTVMNFQVPNNAGTFMTSSGVIKFSRMPQLRIVS